MSVLTGFFPNNAISSLTYQGYNASISISFYSQATHEAWLTNTGLYNGIVTNNLPVTNTAREISGFVSKCWWDDFYNRVHISPSIVNAGNLLAAKTYDIEVWSAYVTPKLLSGITQTGAEGINLDASTPVYYAPTESKIYPLTITLNGPSSINASYSFSFPDETPVLRVTGNRAVLWPFIPQEGFEERLQWKTDIIPSQNNEQRLALRVAPRQAISHKFLLNEKQFSRAKAISTQGANRVYGVPVWSEVTQLQSGPSIGATTVVFDTRHADYRDDSFAVLWESDTKCKVIEIDTVTTTQLNLKTPLEESWGKCFVAPVRKGRTFNGISYSRSAIKDVYADATFDISDNADLADEGSFVSYRGYPVLTDRTIVIGDISEKISRTLEYFDNGSGPIETESSNNIINHLQTISFIKDGSEDIWNFRKWLHARKGKQKGFWLPSWNTDIVILNDVISTDTQFIIENIEYSLYYSTKDIMITLKNGTRVFTRAVAGNPINSTSEQLVLGSTIGTSFNADDIDFVCFLSYVRFDTDDVTLTHDYNRHMKVSINVTETPEE